MGEVKLNYRSRSILVCSYIVLIVARIFLAGAVDICICLNGSLNLNSVCRNLIATDIATGIIRRKINKTTVLCIRVVFLANVIVITVINEIIACAGYKCLENIEISVTEYSEAGCIEVNDILVESKTLCICNTVVFVHIGKLVKLSVEGISLRNVCADLTKLACDDNYLIGIKTQICDKGVKDNLKLLCVGRVVISVRLALMPEDSADLGISLRSLRHFKSALVVNATNCPIGDGSTTECAGDKTDLTIKGINKSLSKGCSKTNSCSRLIKVNRLFHLNPLV